MLGGWDDIPQKCILNTIIDIDLRPIRNGGSLFLFLTKIKHPGVDDENV
jgi:hypothetical protein